MNLPPVVRWMACAVLSVACAAEAAFAREAPSRQGGWEFSIGPTVLLADTLRFSDGAMLETDDDLGFVFTLGYHVSPRFLLSAEMSWNNVGYEASLPSVDDPPGEPARGFGEFDLSTLSGAATWHLLSGRFTPFLSAGLGWTWVDTGITIGPPQLACWWHPWYGHICRPFQATRTEESASYGPGGGFRWEFGTAHADYDWFARLRFDRRWADLNRTDGTPSFDSIRLEFGAKF
jgi:opacity protein-like surface antigen